MVREYEAPPPDWVDTAREMSRWGSITAVDYGDLLERVARELDEDAREATRQAVEEAFA